MQEKLSSDSDDYFLSPQLDGFSFAIHVHRDDIVVTGLRVLVGSASEDHIPTAVFVQGRRVPTKANCTRWIDVPLNDREAIASVAREGIATITFGASSSHDASSPPLIDALQLFGQTKKEFGLERKIRAMSLNASTRECQRTHEPYSLVHLVELFLKPPS